MMRPWWHVCLVIFALMSSGCVRKIAINSLADALSGDGASAFTTDDDLQFVGEAIPFALKTMESLADSAPEHDGIRETLCGSYTQYAMVYVSWPAEQHRWDDYEAYEAGGARTKKFLSRSRSYCMEAFELRYPGFTEQLSSNQDAALARLEVEDVPLLYWAGASWLAAISLSKEDMDMIGALPVAAAMVKRAYDLDKDWDKGAVHDLLILLEPSLPMPGGMERSREHYERSVELAAGTRASPHVSLALSVSVYEQNRKEFIQLMESALEVDANAYPESQLANLYAQEQARFYLEHIDDLFLD